MFTCIVLLVLMMPGLIVEDICHTIVECKKLKRK